MNITKVTENYLDSRPSISDCIKSRLINYSKLSRRIIKDAGLKSSDFDAVLIACRRYYRKILKSDVREEKIIAILSSSKVEVKNKIAVVVVDKDIFSEDLIALEKKAKKLREAFYAIEGTKAITLVISADFLDEVKSSFKGSINKAWTNLALVIVKSPEGSQDETPGFMAFLSGRISQRNINILEFMSCWSETLFVVDEKDVAAVMGALRI